MGMSMVIMRELHLLTHTDAFNPAGVSRTMNKGLSRTKHEAHQKLYGNNLHKSYLPCGISQ